jgi:DnaK suppressor protein
MPRTLVAIPQPPHPDLAANLPMLRAMLEEQRMFRLEQLADLASAVQPSRGSDEDEADAGQDEVAEALATAARRALDDVELALSRIDTGQYGTCLLCGTAINLERLHILPQSSHCVDCQRRSELRR